jgi:ElaB/YqjD/DUF883 family membrane-anchored ribosome-binding protein
MSVIMRLRQARNAEQIAAELEPLAQAMAALTDETRETLAEIERRSREQAENFTRQINEAAQAWKEAAAEARIAAESLDSAGQRMEWKVFALAGLIGLTTAVLVIACWLWLAPSPVIRNEINPEAVAEHLRPAIIDALKRR